MAAFRLCYKYLGFICLTALVLTGCGGGGGSSNFTSNNSQVLQTEGSADSNADSSSEDTSTESATNESSNGTNAASPDRDLLLEASRFASRATFGLNYTEIEALAEQGIEEWLESQFTAPLGRHLTQVNHLFERWENGAFDEAENVDVIQFSFRRYVWWHMAIGSGDKLRQRIAFALSQIFVASDQAAGLDAPRALPAYYDILIEHAFGNYRDLLSAVTLSPAMGVYLSHINNGKANPITNTFPDENYAREVMQLFSIGLHQLNPDGSPILDGSNQQIPTYDNNTIREFAKVFTGLSSGGPDSFFGNPWPDYLTPMVMFEDYHETGEKNLLNGIVIPNGLSGMEDIDIAIDTLFNHPNVGPFVGKRLIQRLVTSNPSPAYISRVASTFNDNGAGVRGDMKSIIRAILLDPEALDPVTTHANFGKLREPIVRLVQLARMFNIETDGSYFYNGGYFVQRQLNQHPLSSPTVFNFFMPNHMPTGELASVGIVAPEFQITNNTTIINISNLSDNMVIGNFLSDTQKPPFPTLSLNLKEYTDLAFNADTLIDKLDLVMTYGTLSPETRETIKHAAEELDDLEFRTKHTIFLIASSPDFAVQL